MSVTATPGAPNPALPAATPIDLKLVGATAAVGSVVGSGAMFAALQAVDRTDRSSSTAAAASAMLDVTNGKLRAGIVALGVAGVAGGATDGAGQVQMDSKTRSLAIGGGIAALSAEGVHMGYSALFYPHGGAFKPFQMADNLTERYHRINAEVPSWIDSVRQVDAMVARIAHR
jgi:hypothetical protein